MTEMRRQVAEPETQLNGAVCSYTEKMTAQNQLSRKTPIDHLDHDNQVELLNKARILDLDPFSNQVSMMREPILTELFTFAQSELGKLTDGTLAANIHDNLLNRIGLEICLRAILTRQAVLEFGEPHQHKQRQACLSAIKALAADELMAIEPEAFLARFKQEDEPVSMAHTEQQPAEIGAPEPMPISLN